MAGSINLISLCMLALCLFLGRSRAVNSSGCGRALASGLKTGGIGQSNKVTFKTSTGLQRTFLLHFPKAYSATRAHGLIFSFHGRGGTGAGQESLSKLSDPAKNPHHLVVYPDGIHQEWQGDPDATTDDVGFTLDMIKSLSNQYCIDTDQIYATGMSNGAGFSANILACHPIASKKIAAFAGVSGAYYQGNTEKNCNAATIPLTACSPGRKPVPILEFHGSADDTIPYKGGPRRDRCLPNLPHFMTGWAERNGLGTKNASTSLFGGHVKKYEFGKAAGLEGINTHYWIEGMGHTWPNAKANYFNATPVIMDFFKKWTLATTPGAGVIGGPSPPRSLSVSHSHTAAKPSATSTLTPTTICPGQDGKTFASGGKKFQITCSADTPNSPYGPVSYPGSFAACIAKCASDSKCGHVSYTTACYLKTGSPNSIKKSGGTSPMVAVKG